MLQGTLSVHIGDEEHALARGDSMYFDSTRSSRLPAPRRGACSAIVVTAS